MIRITKMTTAEIRGTRSRLSFDSPARISSPTPRITEKQISPGQKPVLTSDMAISIGVKVPIV